MEVVTSAFAFAAPFSPWVFLAIVLGIVLLFVLEGATSNSATDFGPFGSAAMFLLMGGIISVLWFIIAGIGPHTDTLIKDITSQTSITNVDWQGDKQFVGKSAEGKYVSCALLPTVGETIYKVVCN